MAKEKIYKSKWKGTGKKINPFKLWRKFKEFINNLKR